MSAQVFETKEIAEYPRSKVLKGKRLNCKVWKQRRSKGEAKEKPRRKQRRKQRKGEG